MNVVHVVSTSAASVQDDLDYFPKLMPSLQFLCHAYSSCKVPSPFHFGNIIIFKVQIFSFQYFCFVNVEYVLVGSSVASFEGGFILRSNWKRIVRR